jgi:DNA-binding CsgD family transcriptional regulator
MTDSAGNELARDRPSLLKSQSRSAPGHGDGRYPGLTLLDRQAERASIDRALRSVRDGSSATLVIRGPPGVGKTALLGYAADAAPDMGICGVIGIESEINLEFAALHQLLIPFIRDIEDLPGPQRQAMRVAFGMDEGPPADRFLVGLAALTLLARAAEERPVLCLIDDAEWLDTESAHALGFVARRLYADRVGMLVVQSEPAAADAFEQFPQVRVGGLPAAEAGRLLRSVVGAPVADRVLDRILADTERNPLALVEIGTEFTPDELAGRASLPEPVPLSRRLVDRFSRQVRELDPDTQAFLLLAAAGVLGDRAVLWRAARRGGIDADTAAANAESAGLVQLSASSVQFRYPLIRSAIYHGAADQDRRRAHLLLSEATSGTHPDLQAWHQGAAATGPDEDVASALERAAGDAQARGGYAARAGLLRRSIELTPDDGLRARREIALAEAELMSGHPDKARDLADAALGRLTDPGARAAGERLRGEILFVQGNAAESAKVLADAARSLDPDRPAGRETMAAAMWAAVWAGPVQTRDMAITAAACPHLARSEASVADLLLEGYEARFTAGYGAAVEPFRAAISVLRSADLEPDAGLRWYAMGAEAAGSLWDADALLDIAGRFVRTARARGALIQLPVALAMQAIADWVAGRLADAEDRWTEMREIIAASDSWPVLGIDSRGEGLVLAYTGRVAAAKAAGASQIRECTARGQGGIADIGRAIVAIADMCDRDYDSAEFAAATVVGHDQAFTTEAILPELVETAWRSDHHREALNAFGVLSERTLAAGTPWALGVRSRCAALIEEDDRAEDAYQEAISQLQRSRATVELARSHLFYGQWLRRAKRRREARHQLRAAYDMFDAMGADAFTDLASAELSATGERARARRPETTFDLTPQEARVAGLAAEGETNNQIAAELFVSPRTVEYHLGKVFRKLGVTSRAQLARRLPASAQQARGEPAGHLSAVADRRHRGLTRPAGRRGRARPGR